MIMKWVRCFIIAHYFIISTSRFPIQHFIAPSVTNGGGASPLLRPIGDVQFFF
jgi:hypothetical protein